MAASPELSAGDDLPVATFASREAWAGWLADTYDASPGLILHISRKDAEPPTVTMAQAVEVALTYGWFDCGRTKLDDDHALLRCTPRPEGSTWTKAHRDKAEQLHARGELHAAGIRALDAAGS